MYRESGGSSSRHSHQSHGGGKSGHHGGREHGRKHHSRESRRERQDPYRSSPSISGGEQQQQQSSGGRSSSGSHHPRSGGFEIGIPTTSSRKSDIGSSDDAWFGTGGFGVGDTVTSTPQTPPSATPKYLATLALEPAVILESELRLVGESEIKEPEPRVPLWHEGWKPRPITCTIPKLYEPPPPAPPLPQNTASVSAALDFPRDRDGNNLVLHSVALQSYIQEVREMIASLPDQPIPDPNASEHLPKRPTRNQQVPPKQPTHDPLTATPHVPHLCLPRPLLGKLQRKSVAAMCSFAGYESSSPEALGILSDLLGSFLSNFSKFLKLNTHHSSVDKGCLGFHDALERSLQEGGMGGKDGLCQYWKMAVLSHSRRLEAEADEFRNSYLRLTVPEEKLQGSSSIESSMSVSSPFSNSKIFSPWPQDHPSSEEEMPLDDVMQQQQTRTSGLGSPDIPPVSVPTLTDPNIIPPDSEGFIPLDFDEEPPRKRRRTVSSESERI